MASDLYDKAHDGTFEFADNQPASTGRKQEAARPEVETVGTRIAAELPGDVPGPVNALGMNGGRSKL